MGGLRGRIKKAEQRARAGPTPPCPACGDKIICEERHADGSVTYPGGGPCETCGSRGASGRVARIVVDMRDWHEDEPEGDGLVWP